MDLLHGAFHHMEDQVDVMDHQVQYHAHISTPRVELRQPMRLDEHRINEVGQRGLERRIVSLHMAHLDLTSTNFGQPHQFIRFRNGLRHWLLDEYM